MRIKERDPETGQINTFFVDLPVELTLDEHKQKKILELDTECNRFILSTFTSNCLGSNHIYDYSYESQTNFSTMLGAINAGMTSDIIECKTEDSGVLNHSIEEFKQLFIDGMLFRQTNTDKYRNLKDQVNSCTTVNQVLAINW